jgi:hypothetical protein
MCLVLGSVIEGASQLVPTSILPDQVTSQVPPSWRAWEATLSQYRQNYAFPLIRALLRSCRKAMSFTINYELPKTNRVLSDSRCHGKVFVSEWSSCWWNGPFGHRVWKLNCWHMQGRRVLFKVRTPMMSWPHLVETSELVVSWAPTTCAYQHVYSSESTQGDDPGSPVFCHARSCCCVLFFSQCWPDFGLCFSHYTSCCVVVQDG